MVLLLHTGPQHDSIARFGFFVPPPFAIAHHLIRLWSQQVSRLCFLLGMLCVMGSDTHIEHILLLLICLNRRSLLLLRCC